MKAEHSIAIHVLAMSLQKSLFHKKFGSLGPAQLRAGSNRASQNGIGDEAEENNESQDSLAPLCQPLQRHRRLRSCAEASATDFFETSEKLARGSSSFQVYYTRPVDDAAPLFIFHHGAGSSGMSFAPLVKELQRVFKSDKEESDVCGVISFDSRGHGQTTIVEDADDYSMDKLVEDGVFVIMEMLNKVGWGQLKNPIFLVGHSLGGSVLTNACSVLKSKGVHVQGLVLLDIVEETALRSLNSMPAYIAHLPKSFPSLESAIDWNVSAGSPRNKASAMVTVPPLLINIGNNRYVWKMDLSKTEPFWTTWFEGLSQRFVKAHAAKLLILAGTDSLDKELMIGQMQGKYQLVVYQDSGHFIQEDVPLKTALTLLDFWKRNSKQNVVIKSTWGGKIAHQAVDD